jgi:DNA-directed RNA polymerase specialized sigma24 family protein
MQIELSPDDIETIIREADAAAQRLRRKLCLPICEREDLGQDLLVDLLRRLPAYDPSRGSIGAFANIVLRNQSSRIAIRDHRQRRTQGGPLLSLEVPLAGSRKPVGETLTEDDGFAAWHGQSADAFADVERRLDLERGLGALTRDDGGLCGALCHSTVDQLASSGRGARSGLYRRVKEIRLALIAHGVAAT